MQTLYKIPAIEDVYEWLLLWVCRSTATAATTSKLKLSIQATSYVLSGAHSNKELLNSACSRPMQSFGCSHSDCLVSIATSDINALAFVNGSALSQESWPVVQLDSLACPFKANCRISRPRISWSDRYKRPKDQRSSHRLKEVSRSPIFYTQCILHCTSGGLGLLILAAEPLANSPRPSQALKFYELAFAA